MQQMTDTRKRMIPHFVSLRVSIISNFIHTKVTLRLLFNLLHLYFKCKNLVLVLLLNKCVLPVRLQLKTDML